MIIHIRAETPAVCRFSTSAVDAAPGGIPGPADLVERCSTGFDRITPDKSALQREPDVPPQSEAYRCTIYIMRRTQLYLDEQLWEVLHARAQTEKTTVSELVRQAARDRYIGNPETRMAAMRSFVGIRKSRPHALNSSEEVRQLRSGSRLDGLRGR